LRERWYANLRQIRNGEFRHTTWYPIEPIERLIVHDHRYPIGAKSHIELQAIELLCSCDKRGETVLTQSLVMCSAMREKEWAAECFTCATDRARAMTQEAAPAAGSVIVNVVPTPADEGTVISPP
jgi:hypothetical protein